MPRWSLFAWALPVVLPFSACRRMRPHSPEAAFRALSDAVVHRDASALFLALDERTREAIDGAYGYEHEMATLVASSYPPGEDRDNNLRTLGAALHTAGGRELFVALASQEDPFASLQPILGSGFARMEMQPPDSDDPGARSDVLTRSGARIPFRENPDGTWGYDGLASEWHERMVRDSHEVVTFRENARLYGGGAGGIVP